jgi:hypothetical protein
MPRCGGFKPNGTPCERIVGASQSIATATIRSAPRSAGGPPRRPARAKPSKEIQSIKARLSELADGVLEGEVNRGDAAFAGQLLGTVIRAIGTELKVREQTELIERFEELEAIVVAQRKGA